jgi:signal transduction histidine kinase
MSPTARSVARVLADAASALSSHEDAARRLALVLQLLAESVHSTGAALHVRNAPPGAGDIAIGDAAGEAALRAETVCARLDVRAELAEGFIDNQRADSRVAVPLVSHDMDVLGVILLLRPADDPYSDEELQRLSVAGSLISSYLAWLSARAAHAALVERERAARERAESASRAKDVFLANLSHELRTPLNAIVGWASLLRKGGLNEATVHRAIEVIDRSAKAEAQLIDDVLDVSRIVSGKLRFEMLRVDLRAVVAAVVEAVQPTAEVRQIALSAEMQRDLEVMADAARLHQVFWNLLSNAVKFTPKGGCIDVTARRVDGTVEVDVHDTGIGIHPDFVPHLFERFSQADASAKRENGGLGLGLAIVRHIVEAHGGSVAANSAGEGRGATFTVRLPAAASRDGRRPAVTDEPTPRSPQATGLAGLRVLVVDDDPDARELLQCALTPAGALVRAASSGAEASALLAAHGFDLLLVDIGMPAEDGHAFLRRIRAEGCQAVAIALTAYGRPDDKRTASETGFARHVTKPIDTDDLVVVIRQTIGAA